MALNKVNAQWNQIQAVWHRWAYLNVYLNTYLNGKIKIGAIGNYTQKGTAKVVQ